MRDELAKKMGWDGKKPLLGLAVINPFCWPVKADLGRALLGYRRTRPETHYAGWYFFSDSAQRRRLFKGYLASIAGAVDEFVDRHGVQVVILGMDAFDQDACTRQKDSGKNNGNGGFRGHWVGLLPAVGQGL